MHLSSSLEIFPLPSLSKTLNASLKIWSSLVSSRAFASSRVCIRRWNSSKFKVPSMSRSTPWESQTCYCSVCLVYEHPWDESKLLQWLLCARTRHIRVFPFKRPSLHCTTCDRHFVCSTLSICSISSSVGFSPSDLTTVPNSPAEIWGGIKVSYSCLDALIISVSPFRFRPGRTWRRPPASDRRTRRGTRRRRRRWPYCAEKSRQVLKKAPGLPAWGGELFKACPTCLIVPVAIVFFSSIITFATSLTLCWSLPSADPALLPASSWFVSEVILPSRLRRKTNGKKI